MLTPLNGVCVCVCVCVCGLDGWMAGIVILCVRVVCGSVEVWVVSIACGLCVLILIP